LLLPGLADINLYLTLDLFHQVITAAGVTREVFELKKD
jgi:hypothetical protein